MQQLTVEARGKMRSSIVLWGRPTLRRAAKSLFNVMQVFTPYKRYVEQRTPATWWLFRFLVVPILQLLTFESHHIPHWNIYQRNLLVGQNCLLDNWHYTRLSFWDDKIRWVSARRRWLYMCPVWKPYKARFTYSLERSTYIDGRVDHLMESYGLCRLCR